MTSENSLLYMHRLYAHSKQPGLDKDLNDQTNALTKTGALHGNLWSPPAQPLSLDVAAITRSQRTVPATVPTSQPLLLAPQISSNDIADLQASDTSIQTMINHLSDHFNHPITASEHTVAPGLKQMNENKHMLHVKENFLWYAPDDTVPKGGHANVCPQCPMCGTTWYQSPTYETLK